MIREQFLDKTTELLLGYLIEQIELMLKDGFSWKEIGKKLGVNASTAHRWYNRCTTPDTTKLFSAIERLEKIPNGAMMVAIKGDLATVLEYLINNREFAQTLSQLISENPMAMTKLAEMIQILLRLE